MIHIIIGDNSTGKTLMFENELMKHKRTDLVTNSDITKNIPRAKVSKSKFHTLYYWSEIELALNNDRIVAAEDVNFPVEIADMLTMLVADRQYLFLDEPFKQIPVGWHGYFMDAFMKLARTFKDVWATTHTELMTLCGDNDTVYYLVNKGGTTKVNSDEALEILDTI